MDPSEQVQSSLTAEQAAVARLSAVLHLLSEAALILNAAGKIHYANHAAEALFSYPPGELEQQLVELLVPPRHRHVHVTLRNDYTQAHNRGLIGGLQNRRLRGLKADGSEFPVELSVNPLVFDGVKLLVVITRDISDVVSATETIEQRVKQYRTVLETLPGTVYHRCHDDAWTLLYFNGDIAELTGLAVERITPGDRFGLKELIPSSDRARIERAFDAVTAAEQEGRFEVESY